MSIKKQSDGLGKGVVVRGHIFSIQDHFLFISLRGTSGRYNQEYVCIMFDYDEGNIL